MVRARKPIFTGFYPLGMMVTTRNHWLWLRLESSFYSTIEEKIFQRQAHKKALSSCVVDEEEVHSPARLIPRYDSECNL